MEEEKPMELKEFTEKVKEMAAMIVTLNKGNSLLDTIRIVIGALLAIAYGEAMVRETIRLMIIYLEAIEESNIPES